MSFLNAVLNWRLNFPLCNIGNSQNTHAHNLTFCCQNKCPTTIRLVAQNVGWKMWKTKGKAHYFPLNPIFLGVTSCMFLTTVYLSVKLLEHCNCPSKENVEFRVEGLRKFEPGKEGHRLAVLVPFRNRFEELLEFGPFLETFLKLQGVQHDIFILNQVDSYRFNRASLINVGFLLVRDKYDYLVMHDVDLLPLNGNLSYGYPEQPMHLAAPTLHPRYHYDKFIGGILLITREHFSKVNGLSNRYWGWGLEDDEFYVRLKDSNLNITRPQNITTGTTNTFKHIHGKHRKRDTVKCYNQKEVTRRRDRKTGLHDVKYSIQSSKKLTIENTLLTVVNIELFCDFSETPWCDCTQKKSPGKT